MQRRLGRNGAIRRRAIWWKGYFLSQGSSCQSDLVAFVVPPFHCDLTLSQGETRDKHSGLPSISYLTPPFSVSLSLPLSSRHMPTHQSVMCICRARLHLASSGFTPRFKPGKANYGLCLINDVTHFLSKPQNLMNNNFSYSYKMNYDLETAQYISHIYSKSNFVG